MPARADSMQRASVSASFRHGMTMLNSTGPFTRRILFQRSGLWRARVFGAHERKWFNAAALKNGVNPWHLFL
jgi:hypothetical protein